MSAVESLVRARPASNRSSGEDKKAIKAAVAEPRAVRRDAPKSWWSTFAFPAYSGLLEIV